jgi:Na+-translocating ferredoxin:NAD+ oxidoreductase RnfG subunit
MKHFKIIFVLSLTVVLSMVGVYLVEGYTTPIIQARLNEATNAALLEFFPNADEAATYEITDQYPEDPIITNIYLMPVNGEPAGVVYRGLFAGYQQGIEVLLALRLDSEEIIGMTVLRNSETAGRGKDLLESPAFLAQYQSVSLSTVRDDGVDMPAGTSAPITLGGVNRSIRSMLIYHGVNFLGLEAPKEETPDDIKERLLLTWFGEGATFTDLPVEANVPIIELKQSSTGGFYLIATFKGSGGPSGEGITQYMVGFNDNTILGLEALTIGETPEYGGVYMNRSDFKAQFINVGVEEFITEGLDAYTGATVTRVAFDQALYQLLAYVQTQLLDFDQPTPRAIDEEVMTALDNMFEGVTFTNESIKSGNIYGVFTGRVNDVVEAVVYYIVHDNGGITSPYNTLVNHSLIHINPATGAIEELRVIRNNSSYTTHFPDSDKGVELDGVDMSFLRGISAPGNVSRDDFDVMSGASTEPGWDTMPALVKAIDQVLTYQQQHQIGGS